MATVSKQGKGYKITASKGYDINGKQLREYMTWIPEPHMTDRQIKKELERQKVLFEEQVKNSVNVNKNIKLVDFTEIFMQEYAQPNLKKQTIYNYGERIKVINQALGHIKIKDLSPRHIASFYANLKEEGIRVKQIAICKIDLNAWVKKHHTTVEALSRKSGVSRWAFNQSKNNKPIAIENAKIIANTLGMDFDTVYEIKKNMKPLETESIRTYHRMLSTILTRAVKWGYIPENPVAKTDLPTRQSVKASKIKYLEEDDARKLLNLLQEEPIKLRTFFTFDLLSGLRRGEIAGLYWSDIDWVNQTVSINRTLNYVPKAGVYEDTPKTASSERPLKLTPSAFVLLQKYKHWQDEQKADLGDAWEDTQGRIFTNNFGKPIFPSSATQWFSHFIERTGLPKVTVHSLRHTYASLMIADGIPLIVVSRQLGHAQASTTANIYAHALKSAEEKATQVFNRFDDVVSGTESESTVKHK